MAERNYRKYPEDFKLEELTLLKQGQKSAGQIERGQPGIGILRRKPSGSPKMRSWMGRSPITSEKQAYFEEQMDMLHQDMDAAQFERIWTSGRALTMEQALGFALGENTG